MKRIAILGTLAAIAMVLAGCSSVSSSLDQSLKSSISATATAALQTRLVIAGSSPTSLAATTYGDAAKELNSAEQGVAELAPGPSDTATRQRTLDGIRTAIDAVIQAQNALNAGKPLTGADAALRAAVAELKSIEKRVKP